MNRDDFFAAPPYRRFKEFTGPGADRRAILCSVLEELSLPYAVLDIAGKHHIVAGSHAAGRGSETPGILLTAHYDRSPRSSGANDNGAAVFLLAETAALVRRRGDMPPALFVFTDGEELSGDEGLQNQGAYGLGMYLREKGFEGARIFCFDACGAGDTLIISTTADQLLKGREENAGAEALRRKVQDLRRAALEAARTARLEKVLLIPTPFSDDGGFLRAGLAAQTITVLPRKEAAPFAALVRRKGEVAAALLSRAAAPPEDRRSIPETWRCLNGPSDSPLRLTPEHWKQVTAFAAALISGS
ncbi:MAG: Zn-dependent exopeptidase M28 [Treponema sp.]|jgi:hypothetical protein|nr:Zn-dependent exopeptidase M28 [Treponema sp.]